MQQCFGDFERERFFSSSFSSKDSLSLFFYLKKKKHAIVKTLVELKESLSEWNMTVSV